MKISKKIREQMQKYCGSTGEDDFIDPRTFHEITAHSSDHEARRLRLCGQVARTLRSVLPESADALVREIEVQTVEPQGGKNTLRVVVRLPADLNSDKRVTMRELLQTLRRQEGWLRSEIASAITRKRVPRLSFAVEVSSSTQEDK